MKYGGAEPQVVTYLHQKGRKLGLPVAGNFELTPRCNFNCPMCYVHMTQQQIHASGRQELRAEQWLQLAEAAQKKGMVFALLTGGEPLIREDFFTIYEGMKRLGLLISINSNGSLLTQEHIARLASDPPLRMHISLYGGSNETYRIMCGQPAYERVLENIRALRNAGVEVNINLSITPYNCGDLDKIYGDAQRLGVHVKASSYMYPPTRLEESAVGSGNRLSAEDAARYALQWDCLRFTQEEMAQRADWVRQNLQQNREGCPLEMEQGVRCRAGSSSFWINWDGSMTPCGMMSRPVAYPLRDGFDTAWNQIREAVAAIRMPPKCSTCDHRDTCGVCAAVCLTETGKFDAVPEYMCRKTKAQMELLSRIDREV